MDQTTSPGTAVCNIQSKTTYKLNIDTTVFGTATFVWKMIPYLITSTELC